MVKGVGPSRALRAFWGMSLRAVGGMDKKGRQMSYTGVAGWMMGGLAGEWVQYTGWGRWVSGWRMQYTEW